MKKLLEVDRGYGGEVKKKFEKLKKKVEKKGVCL